MKKHSYKKSLYAFILVLALIAPVLLHNSLAQSSGEMIKAYRNNVTLEVNGTRVGADNFIYNGTTYVPMRAIAEMLGKEVGWNAFTYIASINDLKYERDLLSSLLPRNVGYSWLYDGFAEYSHEMRLDSISDIADKRTYSISGEVGDPSGGESTVDRSISIKYVIQGRSLVQEKIEKAMLDSKFDRITLIKTPLEAGNYWSETIHDKSGKSALINSMIRKVEVKSDGKKEYTVRYSDSNSPYYEERIIREGEGIIAFEKLLELDEMSFPAGYNLFRAGEFREISVKLYFPDRNADKLHLQTRTITIEDAQTARGAVEALIAGPEGNVLMASIPSGTRLLGIRVSNGTCYVDFSREFIDNHSGGSAGELMTLGSIVNTLTEFTSIQRVQILVEGKSGETLGNILLDRPLNRMSDMIAR